MKLSRRAALAARTYEPDASLIDVRYRGPAIQRNSSP